MLSNVPKLQMCATAGPPSGGGGDGGSGSGTRSEQEHVAEPGLLSEHLGVR